MKAVFVVLFSLIALSSFSQAGAEIELEPFAKVNGPIGIVWDGSKFLVSVREKGNESVSKLATVSNDGSSIKPILPNFAGGHEVYFAMSHGLNGFPKGHIYMVSFDAIVEIQPSLTSFRNLSRPYPFDPAIFLAFDTVGSWGNALLATTEDGSIWSIDALGNAERIIVLGQHTWFEGIAVAPLDFGKIGGYLVLSSKEQEKVIAISPDKQHKVVDIASFTGEQPEHVFFIPPSKDLLIAVNEENQIMRVSAQQLKPYVGSMFLVTEGERDRIGSIYAITPSGDGYNVTRLFSKKNPHFEGYTFVEPKSDFSALYGSSFPYLLVGIAGIMIIVGMIAANRKSWAA